MDDIDPGLDALLQAADLACDFHHDSAAARAAMQADCMATPPHMRADLIDHFEQTYGTAPRASRDEGGRGQKFKSPSDWKPGASSRAENFPPYEFC